MRKTLIGVNLPTAAQASVNTDNSWFDLDEIATVEITSEDPRFPIEQALGGSATEGWRASAKGPQVIRLSFDKPLNMHRIHLEFGDSTAERTQEFAIYASSPGGALREVLRQQFTFSPGGSSEEIEDYSVNLTDVSTLEIRIDPDRAHDPTHSQHFAVLRTLRLA